MKYPIGIQSFDQLISDGYVYVDSKHSKKYTLHALWFDCNFAPHNNQTE